MTISRQSMARPSPVATSPFTCFAGLLLRDSTGWSWASGEREPLVRDATERIDARRRRTAWNHAAPMVEVPLAIINAYDRLAWVAEGMRRGDFHRSISTGFAPDQAKPGDGGADDHGACMGVEALGLLGTTVVLVPEWQWRSWRDSYRVMPWWHWDDEAELFVRARDRGWHEWRVAARAESRDAM